MTPLFWPARSWDKPETTLNQVQSDKLFSEVKTITDITVVMKFLLLME